MTTRAKMENIVSVICQIVILTTGLLQARISISVHTSLNVQYFCPEEIISVFSCENN